MENEGQKKHDVKIEHQSTTVEHSTYDSSELKQLLKRQKNELKQKLKDQKAELKEKLKGVVSSQSEVTADKLPEGFLSDLEEKLSKQFQSALNGMAEGLKKEMSDMNQTFTSEIKRLESRGSAPDKENEEV